MESSSTNAKHHQQDESSHRRNKRPYRLLPITKDEPNHEPIRIFYGPPTNCSDLSRLGHTLNGFYQVQSNISTKNEDDLTTDTIYCAFKQPERTFNPHPVQKRVHNLGSIISKLYFPSGASNKSSGGAHFHVETTSALKITKVILKSILFKNVVLNMGSGYNSNSGVFTVPKTGIYQFTFSGSLSSTTAKQDQISVGILLDVNNMKRTHAMQVAHNQLLNRITSKFYQGNTIAVQIISSARNEWTVDLVLEMATFSGLFLEEFVH